MPIKGEDAHVLAIFAGFFFPALGAARCKFILEIGLVNPPNPDNCKANCPGGKGKPLNLA